MHRDEIFFDHTNTDTMTAESGKRPARLGRRRQQICLRSRPGTLGSVRARDAMRELRLSVNGFGSRNRIMRCSAVLLPRDGTGKSGD